MHENESRVNGKVVSDDESPQYKSEPRATHELSPPLPWDPIQPKPATLSSRAIEALRLDREKRGHYRRRLTELPINSPDWCWALIGAAEAVSQICERCPPELDRELADGGYPIKWTMAAWAEVVVLGTHRLHEAVEARSAAGRAA